MDSTLNKFNIPPEVTIENDMLKSGTFDPVKCIGKEKIKDTDEFTAKIHSDIDDVKVGFMTKDPNQDERIYAHWSNKIWIHGSQLDEEVGGS